MFWFSKEKKNKWKMIESVSIEDLESVLNELDKKKQVEAKKKLKDKKQEEVKLLEEAVAKRALEAEKKEIEEIESLGHLVKKHLHKNHSYKDTTPNLKKAAEKQYTFRNKHIEKLIEKYHTGTLDELKSLLDDFLKKGEISHSEVSSILNKVDPLDPKDVDFFNCLPYGSNWIYFAKYGDPEKTHLIKDVRLHDIAKSVDIHAAALNIPKMTEKDIKDAKYKLFKEYLFNNINKNIDEIARLCCDTIKKENSNYQTVIQKMIEKLLKE